LREGKARRLNASVTVVVPARNRTAGVLASLENVIRSDYEALTVVVFNNYPIPQMSDPFRRISKNHGMRENMLGAD
jgi:hypothetical protein